MRWLALVSLAACGRVGFDARGTDAPPALPDVRPDACTLGAWSTPSRDPGLVSPQTDWGPALTGDTLEIVFHTDRTGGLGGYDLFHATRPDRASPFGTPTPLANVNSTANDEGATLSPDGLTMYFNSFRAGARRVFRATRPDRASAFGAPVMLDALGLLDGPSVSADGTELFGSLPQAVTSDLVRVTAFESAAPVFEMLDTLNTTDDEFFPSLTGDGLTMFYEGPATTIYRAHRSAIGQPFMLDGPEPGLSSPQDDTDPEVSKDGTMLVVASQRGGADFELYIATRSCN